ncbi:MAG: universal stress protein [Fidelibacterota bacterium]
MSYENILLALCCRGDEREVIYEAVELKKKLNANLSVIHVAEPHAGEMSMMMEAPMKFTEDDLRERFVVHGFEKEAKEISIKIIIDENISKVISQESENADLLILGHRKQSSFKKHFFDSVDEGIVNHAQCPVMVVLKD